MQMHGPRSDRAKDRDIHWRIKAKTSEELRQEFLGDLRAADPRARADAAGPGLRLDEAAGEWRYTEPDWNELRTVVTNHGPKSRGAAPVPARPLGGHAVGPRHDPRRRRRPSRDGLRTRRGARARAVGGLPPGEGRRPDAPRRHRHGARRELALHYAREMYSRRQESVQLWVVRRADIHDLADPDLLQPPLDRSFKKPGGYVMRDKLAAARERAGEAKPKADARSDARRRSSRSRWTSRVPATAASARSPCSCCPWPTTSSSSASATPSGPGSRRSSRRTSRSARSPRTSSATPRRCTGCSSTSSPTAATPTRWPTTGRRRAISMPGCSTIRVATGRDDRPPLDLRDGGRGASGGPRGTRATRRSASSSRSSAARSAIT